MRRGSLKRKSGCLRCKRRHKRCDELKPKCSYCTRWRLDCLWPDTTSSETRLPIAASAQTSGDIATPNTQVHQLQHFSPTSASNSPSSLDPFHSPVLRDFVETSAVSRWVQRFSVLSTSANNVYDAAELQSSIIRGWPEFAFLDKAVCAAQVASWAASSVQRRENAPNIATGLEFETLTISRLRLSISPRSPVSEETLMAATVHFIVSAGDILNEAQLRDMIEGFNMMVMSYGGIDAVLQTMSASTVFAVLHCDIFGSLLNAEQHFFVQLEKPQRPQTFAEIYRIRPMVVDVSQYIAPDVVEVFGELSLLLHSRQQSNQSRTLSEFELRHLTLLNQWVDYRLGVLQTQYINDCSLSELVVVALIILKQEIISDEAAHSIMVSTLLSRLQISISNFLPQASQPGPQLETVQILTTWTSLIALAGVPLTFQRLWFADFIHNSLTFRYGPIRDWPRSWEEDLRVELEQLLWHEKIATRYGSLCMEIRGHQQARHFT